MINKIVKKGFKFAGEAIIEMQHIKENESFYSVESGEMVEPSGVDARKVKGMIESFAFELVNKKGIQVGDVIFTYPTYQEKESIEIGDVMKTEEIRYTVKNFMSTDPFSAIKKIHLRPL